MCNDTCTWVYNILIAIANTNFHSIAEVEKTVTITI